MIYFIREFLQSKRIHSLRTGYYLNIAQKLKRKLYHFMIILPLLMIYITVQELLCYLAILQVSRGLNIMPFYVRKKKNKLNYIKLLKAF